MKEPGRRIKPENVANGSRVQSSVLAITVIILVVLLVTAIK